MVPPRRRLVLVVLCVGMSLLQACPAPVAPTSTATCGDGTTLKDGHCQPAVICGPDTTAKDGFCVAKFACGPDTAAKNGFCISATTCGTGTRRGSDDVCTGAVSCAAGTRLEGEACVATASPAVTCGTGTTLQGSECVATGGSTLTCGSGTTQQGNSCVASGSTTVTCGSGTTLQGSECVATAGGPVVTCGPGTVLDAARCVPASASTSISQFVAAQHSIYVADHGGSSAWELELLYTDLDTAQATAYVNAHATPIGTFSMLDVVTGSKYTTQPLPVTPATWSFAIKAPTSCTIAALQQVPYGELDATVGFVRWSGGQASAVCAKAGSVLVTSDVAKTQLTYTLNAAFADGTEILNRVFNAPF